MTRKEIDKEYELLDHELFNNRPIISPYPPDTVKRRELLLRAQVYLAEVLEAKMAKNRDVELYYEYQYRRIMDDYFNWKTAKSPRSRAKG